MATKHNKYVKNNKYWMLGLALIGALSGCDPEGELVEEDTYVAVQSYNFTKLGDTEDELAFYINGKPLTKAYYPEGTELKIELKRNENGEVLLDSTITADFGEEIGITAFYTGETVIPVTPLTDEDRQPAPEGYKKVRFINFIKDGGFLEGKDLRLEVFGVYYTGVNASGFNDEAMTDDPVYTIEHIGPDNFTPFMNLPELETMRADTDLDIEATVAKIYDAATGELLSDVYIEEGEVFPGFPDFGIRINVRGEKSMGNLRNTSNYSVASIQLEATQYEGVYSYNQQAIEVLSEME